jgi:DNA-binding LacI/PurR family transcriptional regulator
VSHSDTKPAGRPIRSTTEFAHHVGLARTTVSRVLNSQPGLKKKTIERVKRAIEETGFVPNAYALHLKGKRTRTVGVCVQNLSFPTLVNKLATLQARLREKGITTFIEVVDGADSSDGAVRNFLSLRVEALVFLGYFDEAKMERQLQSLGNNGTPSLVIDHHGIKGANTVTLDRARGMVAITEHLLDFGHRRFGLLGYSENFRSTHERIRGIREALEGRGLDFDECTENIDAQVLRTSDFEFGRALARTFIERGDAPTAFIALNDVLAAGAIHGVKDMGLRVPEDFSVTGFNNQDICAMVVPNITSVDQRVEKTVKVAVDFVMDQMGKPLRAKPVVKMIDPLLIVRGSTGPVRVR